jgi:hypothetical protein
MEILRTEHFVVCHAADCVVPGYLILERADGISEVHDVIYNALRAVQSHCGAALMAVLRPQRIYFFASDESHRPFQYLICPRTASMEDDFSRDSGLPGFKFNAHSFLKWAREYYKGDASASPQVMATVDSLRARLRTLE